MSISNNKDENMIESEPIKSGRHRVARKVEKVVLDDESMGNSNLDPIVTKSFEEEEEASKAVMDKLDKIMDSPFSKYDAIMEQDEEDDDVPMARPLPAKPASQKIQRQPRSSRRKEEKDEFMIDDESASIFSLNKGNVWGYDVDEVYNMLVEGTKTEHWSENELHYMNILRPVFDIRFIDKNDEKLVARLEEDRFKVYPYQVPTEDTNGIAIRKYQITKITDLTMENIFHIEPADVLKLISENLGTGWKGLPLPIQDIIESAFYVDTSSLPAAAMHRAGGIIDRRKDDGYEVLEIARGTWIEAIFIKVKPKMEKLHFESISEKLAKNREEDDEDLDNDDDDSEDSEEDEIDEYEHEDDDDEDMEEQTPQIEEFEDIPDTDDDDE